MFSGPFRARAWMMHREISSLAMDWCFIRRSAILIRETIFRGSPYSPMPVLVSRSVAANPAYSGLSRIKASKASNRCIIWSSFLLNSSNDLEESSLCSLMARTFWCTKLLWLPFKMVDWSLCGCGRVSGNGLIVNFKTETHTLMLFKR